MKLFTLLQAVEFDEIMPAVADMFPGTGKYRPQLEHAYDLLLRLRPQASQQSIRYKIMDIPGSREKYVGAEDRDFSSPWPVCLGKEVVKERGVNLSEVELAANCLVNVALQSPCPAEFDDDRRVLMQQR